MCLPGVEDGSSVEEEFAGGRVRGRASGRGDSMWGDPKTESLACPKNSEVACVAGVERAGSESREVDRGRLHGALWLY